MTASSRIENVYWFAGLVAQATAFVFFVLFFLWASVPVKLIMLCVLYFWMTLRDDGSQSVFMQACTNHSTEAACANSGTCDLATETFEIDKEWGRYRRNACVSGAVAEKARLLNSYNPKRCGAWGDCSPECVNRLTAIETRINSFTCANPPALEADASWMSSVADFFPTSDSRTVTLWPSSQFAKIYCWFGVGLCAALVVWRSVQFQLQLGRLSTVLSMGGRRHHHATAAEGK